MKKAKKGMTLLEVIAAVAIFLIVSVAITSTMMFSIRANASNKAKLNSNSNSRSFIEYFKDIDNRPVKYEPPVGVTPAKGIKDGVYDMTYKSETDVKTLVNALNGKTIPTSEPKVIRRGISSTVDFNSSLLSVGSNKRSDDKYLITAKVKWDNINLVYVVDIWSWEIEKGRSSEITRRILIGPK